MPRGGHRENAGRKAAWKNSETQVIRVPKAFVPQLIQIAKALDGGTEFELVTKSESELPAASSSPSPGQLNLLESNQLSKNDFVSKSESKKIPGPLSARALSRRLGVDKSGGTVKSKRSSPEFPSWTRKGDPEGFGWIYNEQDKLYYPIIDFVTNSNAV